MRINECYCDICGCKCGTDKHKWTGGNDAYYELHEDFLFLNNVLNHSKLSIDGVCDECAQYLLRASSDLKIIKVIEDYIKIKMKPEVLL